MVAHVWGRNVKRPDLLRLPPEPQPGNLRNQGLPGLCEPCDQLWPAFSAISTIANLSLLQQAEPDHCHPSRSPHISELLPQLLCHMGDRSLGKIPPRGRRLVFRSLAGTIGQTYMQIIGFNRKIEFLKENVRIQEKTVRIVHAKKELGEISALDLEQAISVLETTKGTLEQQILQKELAKNFLCTLLGVAPYDIEECYAFPSVLPLAPPHPDVGIPLDIIRSRPDIRAAEQQAIAQAHIAGIATAEMLPAFSLTGFFGWESANSNRLFNGNSRIAGFGQDIAWDIFNYGRLSNNVVAQNALLQEFLVNYQNVVINACREVEDAMVSYIQDEKIVDRFSEAVRATNRTVELSMTQYEYGAVDFLNVLTAQSNLVAQQLALVDAETAHVIDYINIQTSLGKGWEFTVCKDFVSPCRREKIGNIHYFW